MAKLFCQDVCFEDVEAVLFDKDGTLADSHGFLKTLAATRSQLIENAIPGIAPQLMAAFGCTGIAYDARGLMAVGTRYENEVAAAAYVAATGKSWSEAREIVRVAFVESDRVGDRKASCTPPFVGIPSLLMGLRTSGLKLAVLSGDTTANIRDFLACYELSPFIDWYAGSEAPPIKPDPQMLWEACKQLDVSPQKSLVVGDAVLDYQLAQKGNAQAFISVTWGGSPAVEAADAVISTPLQLRVLSP